MTSWIDKELVGCEFADGRLKKRYRRVLSKLCDGIGQSIPLASRDWANTKAAYRFFANPRVTESDILSGHFEATAARLNQTKGMILVLQDTTEGVPLGLSAAKIWTRKKFKGSQALARKVNRTRVPIEEKESYRWIQNLRESTSLASESKTDTPIWS